MIPLLCRCGGSFIRSKTRSWALIETESFAVINGSSNGTNGSSCAELTRMRTSGGTIRRTGSGTLPSINIFHSVPFPVSASSGCFASPVASFDPRSPGLPLLISCASFSYSAAFHVSFSIECLSVLSVLDASSCVQYSPAAGRPPPRNTPSLPQASGF